MAQLNRLSSRYATAILELSMERGALNENLDQAILLRDVLSEGDVQQIITHPRVSVEEKQSFYKQAFEKHISRDMMSFLNLATVKNRVEFIVPSLDSFIEMANEKVGKTTALVVSAVPLKAEQVKALAALLTKKLEKQVTIEQEVDPSIIGGLYVKVDGYYVDRTIKTRLQEIKLSLNESN